MSKIYQSKLRVNTSGAGFTSLTSMVREKLGESQITNGLCTLFIQHTSASLLIQENADPAVLRDLQNWMSGIAPENFPWEHADEGPDDMPAHARSALTKTSETIPVSGGELMLGTWQGIYLWEHRSSPHTRTVVVHIYGE